MPISLNLAKQLLDSGKISQEYYDKYFAPPEDQPGPKPSMDEFINPSPNMKPIRDWYNKNLNPAGPGAAAMPPELSKEHLSGKPSAPAPEGPADTLLDLTPKEEAPAAPEAPKDPTVDLSGINAGRMGQTAGVPMPKFDESGYNEEKEAIRKGELLGIEKAAEKEAYFRDFQARNDKLAAEQEEKARKRKEISDKALGELNAMTDEIMKKEVDPNRFWDNKSLFSKAIASIGLIMGGFGDKGNQAVKVIENAIERDINAQKETLAHQREGVQMKRTLFGDMLRVFDNDVAAEAAARSILWNQMELKAQQLSSKFEGKEASVTAQKLIGELANRKNQNQLTFASTIANVKLQEDQNNIARMNANTQAKATNADIAFKKFELENPHLKNKGVDPRPWTVIGWGEAKAGTPEEIGKLREAIAAETDAVGEINDLIAMAKTSGKSLSIEDRETAQTKIDVLVGKLRVILTGPGAMSEGDRKLIEGVIKNPTKFFSLDSRNITGLQVLKTSLMRTVDSKAATYGLQRPASTGSIYKDNMVRAKY